jgi:hypothetical protein
MIGSEVWIWIRAVTFDAMSYDDVTGALAHARLGDRASIEASLLGPNMAAPPTLDKPRQAGINAIV